ncbi:MAG: trimethylamine methyltransferase family protein [Holophagales bacterium]|jgi:trimethylamine--corrinoid protein Co-methyltransferase|nr:trimethylamine methyltransferase family protein [Holophagales bacterium]
MRPRLRLLDDALAGRILDEARSVLSTLGVELHDPEGLELLVSHGAVADGGGGRVRIPARLVDRALATAPRAFALYDVLGDRTHDLSGENVHFTPGSAAIRILDPATGVLRAPSTPDYVRYARLVAGLPNLAAQSTAFVPSDVPAEVSDSYRLFLSLLFCEKPVVTGAFSAAAFQVMRDLQLAVRGSDAALREKPLAVFTCCPTSPLAWSEATGRNLLDCARAGIPVEIVAVPLSGFLSPVTLTGTLVQGAAENLSGVVLHQLAAPGAPLLWGTSAAVFDIRSEGAATGAIETAMLTAAMGELGKRLGLPTQAYAGVSDSKELDAQAGLETSSGALLAALSGINSISGPGLLDLDNGFSLEKLVVDHEICGMALRLTRGVEPRDDFPALPLLAELLSEKHLLIARHTRRHLRTEITFPGPAIDRSSEARWREDGAETLGARAGREVERLVSASVPSRLPASARRDLVTVMESAARNAGLDRLPGRDPE